MDTFHQLSGHPERQLSPGVAIPFLPWKPFFTDDARAPWIKDPPWVEGMLQAGHDLDLRTHISPAVKPRLEYRGSAFDDKISPLGGKLPTYLRQRLDQIRRFLTIIRQ